MHNSSVYLDAGEFNNLLNKMFSVWLGLKTLLAMYQI
jgi:hypothetical protein